MTGVSSANSRVQQKPATRPSSSHEQQAGGVEPGLGLRASSMARVMSPCAGWWAKASRFTSTTASSSRRGRTGAAARSVRSPDRQRPAISCSAR